MDGYQQKLQNHQLFMTHYARTMFETYELDIYLKEFLVWMNRQPASKLQGTHQELIDAFKIEKGYRLT